MSILRLKQFSLSSTKGFTIVELMVASTIGLLIIGLSLGSVLSNREAYQFDLVRTQLNQNLRSSLDLIGMNVREAGESLPENFPVIELTDGAVGGADTLALRRNLLNEEEVGRVCQTLAAGTTTNTIYIATNGATTSGCIYSDTTQIFSKFQTKRLAEDADQMRAYIFDSSSGAGEWFTYTGDNDNSTEYTLTTDGGIWANTYAFDAAVGPTSFVYLLEEWQFQLLDNATTPDILQVVENSDTANPMNVIWGIENFQVRVHLRDGTILDTFGFVNEWVNIKAVEITLSGESTYRERVLDNSLTARFFPRNVLSK